MELPSTRFSDVDMFWESARNEWTLADSSLKGWCLDDHETLGFQAKFDCSFLKVETGWFQLALDIIFSLVPVNIVE